MKNILSLFLLLLLASCSPDPVTPNGGGNNSGSNSGSNSGNNNGDNNGDNNGGDNGGGDAGEDTSKPYFTIGLVPDTIKTLTYWSFSYIYSTNIEEDISLQSSADWCEVTLGPDSNIIIHAIESYNQTEEQKRDFIYPAPRQCTVTITVGDVYKKTVVVIQEADDAVIQTEGYAYLELNGNGDKAYKHIISNCISWTATTKADWLKLNKIDENTLEIVSTARPDSITSGRSTSVTLTSDLNEWVTKSFGVREKEAEISAGEYKYSEPTPWD